MSNNSEINADLAAEKSEAERAALVMRARGRPFIEGVAGVCESCEEHSLRLVGGRCAPCRDGGQMKDGGLSRAGRDGGKMQNGRDWRAFK